MDKIELEVGKALLELNQLEVSGIRPEVPTLDDTSYTMSILESGKYAVIAALKHMGTAAISKHAIGGVINTHMAGEAQKSTPVFDNMFKTVYSRSDVNTAKILTLSKIPTASLANYL